MDQKLILWTMVGMLAVTYIPRLLPAWLLSSRRLNPTVEKWLSYIPAAVLSALLAPSLFLEGSEWAIRLDNVFLLAAVPTFAMAIATRSFFGTVAVGMVLVALARLVL